MVFQARAIRKSVRYVKYTIWSFRIVFIKIIIFKDVRERRILSSTPLGKVMPMTAIEEVTNQIVTINIESMARQSGETPSWQT